MAWLAARDTQPRIGSVAAVVLSVVCLMSVLFGLFDGDLAGNVVSDGFVSWGFAWGIVLLFVTAVVGLLVAASRASWDTALLAGWDAGVFLFSTVVIPAWAQIADYPAAV